MNRTCKLCGKKVYEDLAYCADCLMAEIKKLDDAYADAALYDTREEDDEEAEEENDPRRMGWVDRRGLP